MFTQSSGEESHVCSSYSLVGVPSGGKHPLGKSSLGAIGTEEIIEDGGVQRLNCLITEIIVVSGNLRTEVIVRLVD